MCADRNGLATSRRQIRGPQIASSGNRKVDEVDVTMSKAYKPKFENFINTLRVQEHLINIRIWKIIYLYCLPKNASRIYEKCFNYDIFAYVIL